MPEPCTALVPHRGPGRPTIYSPALAQAILDAYAAGEPIHAICARDGMPDHRTYRRWKRELPEFAAALAHAREDKAEFLADRALARLEAVDPDSPFGSARVTLGKEKSAYDRWLAGCLDRTYSDRPQVEVNIGSVAVAFAKLSSPRPDDDE